MTGALATFAHTFEGARVPGVMFNGEPCWPARAAGRVAHGVDDGQQFIRNLLESGEAEEGVEYFRVRGAAAQRILAAIEYDGNRPSYSPTARRGRPEVLLLSESGLYLALTLGRSELSKRFRRWLTREVLPSIRRTGSYTAPVEVNASHLPLDTDEPGEAFAHRAKHANAALDAVLERLSLADDQDRSAVRESLRTSAATLANVGGREWGQWTAAEHITVLRALAGLASGLEAHAKRITPMFPAPPRGETRREPSSAQMTLFNNCTFNVGRAN